MKKKLLIASLLMAFVLGGCSNGGAPASSGGADEYVTSVTVSPKEYELDVNESVQLTATVLTRDNYQLKPGELVWSSSLPNYATVTQTGLVVAKKSGTVYITAMAGMKFDTCKIVVKSEDPGPIDTFSLSDSSVTLDAGQSKTLKAYFNSEETTATWVSSNPSAATVNNGVISAVAEGRATITATHSSGLTATCFVVVNAVDPSQFTIILDEDELTLMPGQSHQLHATLSDTSYSVSWSSDDNDVATVSQDGLVTASDYALDGDICTITATANGKSATCNVFISTTDGYDITVYFFLDFNNVDKNDTTGVKKIAQFRWYYNTPLKGSSKGDAPVPSDLADSKRSDPAFPYFIGWSKYTIIDTKDKLWNMTSDYVDGTYSELIIYGVWSDVTKENFNK